MYRKFTVYQEVTAPAGANFITFKHILNDFSLNYRGVKFNRES
jgi:hypothetical protein